MRTKSKDIIKALSKARLNLTAADMKGFADDISALSVSELNAHLSPDTPKAKATAGSACLRAVQSQHKLTSLKSAEFATLLAEAINNKGGCRVILPKATLKSLPKTVEALEKLCRPDTIERAAIDIAKDRSFYYDAS